MNTGEPSASEPRYWTRLVEEHPEVGNVVQYDPDSPFEELHWHNTTLHLVIDGFYSLPDRVEVVSLLLKHGADPNLQNDKGETPLHLACQATMRDPRIARLLLDHGADPAVQTKDGRRPVDYLDEYDRYSREIRAMLESGGSH